MPDRVRTGGVPGPRRLLSGSLLARLLAVCLTIAIAAVLATAWLATRTTSDRIVGEFTRSLEADGFIYNQLLQHAAEEGSWDEVGDLVTELAGRTGRRIALTAQDGTPIADSATAHDAAAPPLPNIPAALLDPMTPVLSLMGATSLTPVEWQALGDTTTLVPVPGGGNERRIVVTETITCLDEAGHAAIALDGARPSVVLRDAVPVVTLEHCGYLELLQPTEAEREVQSTFNAALADCLGAPHADETGTLLSPCVEEAARSAYGPYLADPAVLYLDWAPAPGGPFTHAGGDRTLAAVVGVLLVAVVASVLAGRHLVRPVRVLTGAAQRLADGERSVRVRAGGTDEVGRLAHAFNVMAASLDHTEERRRTMVSDIAHELRSPLTVLGGYLEGAQDGVIPIDDSLMTSLLEETRLLQRLVDDLQQLALADADRLELHTRAVDVAEMVHQILGAHQPAADDAGIMLRTDADEPVVIDGDPARLRQAIGNLITNAIAYTERGGHVTIRCYGSDDAVTVAVIDDGVGIEAHHLPHVFERFYRVDESRARDTGGSGIGLAIVRMLTEAHGGRVDVASSPGEGSTFTITIPRAP